MRLWLIAKSDIKKKKGNAFILFFLIMLATMLLYTGINVLKNITAYLDENYRQQNGADYVVTANAGNDEQIVSVLKSCKGYQTHEAEDLLLTTYNEIGKTDSSEKADRMAFLFEKMNSDRKISNFKILDQGEKCKDNSIVVPMYLKVAKHCKTGDKLSISFDDHTYVFEIYGFVEDVMFASPGNISYYRCYLTEQMYDRIALEPVVTSSRIYNVRVKEQTDMSAFDLEFSGKIAQLADNGAAERESVVGRDYPKMRTGVTMMMNILMSILAVFSIVIVLTAIVVMRFSVVSGMEENISNIGILEALGYTGRQLSAAVILEYMVLTVFGMLSGFLIAKASSDLIAGVVAESIGMQWCPKTDLVAIGITAGVVFLLVLGAVIVTARRYRTITTLEALREGIATHSFQRNHLPLESSHLGLHATLGLKEMLHNKKQNVVMFFIVALLTYASVMVLMVYYNFVVDDKELINLVGLEKPDIQMSLDSERFKEIEREVSALKEVDRVAEMGYLKVVVSNKEKEATLLANVWDDMSKLRLNTILEGRYPTEANEICTTRIIADALGAELGSSVNIKSGNVQKSVLIVGITQQINQMGQCMAMPESVARSLYEAYQPGYLDLYLNEGEDVEQMRSRLVDQYAQGDYIEVSNFDEAYQTILGSYMGAIAALCMIMVGVTAAVVGLTVFLLARMKLIRERKMLGVYKAIGYTTPQLMKQLTVSFLPIVTGGVLLGGSLSAFSTNTVFALALRTLGIENCHMTVSAGLWGASSLALTVYALLVMALAALRIRKIEPYRMITE